MRRAAKRDANEKDIVKVFRAAGRQVSFLSGPKIPDLLVIRPSIDLPIYVCETVDQAIDIMNAGDDICLVEVKMPKDGYLTGDQVEWMAEALNISEEDVKAHFNVRVKKKR